MLYVHLGGAVWYSGVCEQVEAAKISRVSSISTCTCTVHVCADKLQILLQSNILVHVCRVHVYTCIVHVYCMYMYMCMKTDSFLQEVQN